MEDSEWDPLKPVLDDAGILAQKRKEIEGLLISYTGFFDLFSELIQNALDAVDRRAQAEQNSYKPKIWITLNLSENSVKIVDNGMGFTKEQFYSFLSPNISYKSSGKDRGNKGVGATYLAYGFNHLEFGTKTPNFSSYAIFEEGRNWIKGKHSQTPKAKPKDAPKDFVELLDQGSIFLLKLIGDDIHPKNLSWYGAENAEQWDALLRAKTPLGGIYLNKSHPKTICEITVLDGEGNTTKKEVNDLEYLYPHLILDRVAKLSEIRSKQFFLTQGAHDPWGDLPGRFKNLNGFYEIWTHEQLQSAASGDLQPRLTENQKEIMKKEKPIIYVFFGYSTEIWESIREKYDLRKGSYVLNSGVQIACDSMPQGIPRVIPLTQSIGYQKMSLVIIHFENAEPDVGRKGFQPEIEELAASLSSSSINYVKKWKTLLRDYSQGNGGIQQSRELNEWVREQEKHADDYPLHIRNENFFAPVHDTSLLSVPQQEQDVIVLFNQLISGGVIRGIRIMATTFNDRYDSLCKITVSEPLEIHKYDAVRNPLGLVGPQDQGDSAPMVMEYKYDLDGLIQDFDTETKDEADISLVVCWGAGKRWKERYEITPLLLEENINSRPFHGATHIVKHTNGSKAFILICLKELIEYLNEDSVEDYQRTTYLGDE